MLYEILIRGRNGQFSGAHFKETPTSPAQSIKLADWPEVCADINTTLFNTVEDLQAQLATVTATLETERAAFQAYKEAAEGALKVAGDAIADPELDDTSTLEVVRTAVAEISKPVAQRELEKLEADEAARVSEVEAKRQSLLAAINA